MEEDHFPSLSPSNVRKTNENTSQLEFTTMVTLNNDDEESGPTEKQPLSTKSALKFLIEGNLKSKVCRYCLNVDCMLSELDQILNIAGSGTIYKVTIRDIVASFHPVKVADDPNFPNKICDKCLKLAISSFLFTQQCERAERALRNCLTDIYDKVDKLDRMDNTKKRGRQKLHPNYNVIHAEFNYVIEYAKPTINIINRGTETMYSEPIMTELECARCWQVLPNIESLLIHERTHPKNMWYNCRLCGKSFPKHAQMKKHYHRVHVLGLEPIKHINNDFNCAECGHITDNYKQHLLHVEKHKFKNVMEHLVENKMDKLCMVCFDKSNDLVELENMVSFHGGCPELMGDKPLYSILASTLPDPKLYKYQELHVANRANILNIRKKNTVENESKFNTLHDSQSKTIYDRFIWSKPVIISHFDRNMTSFDSFVYSEPLTIDCLLRENDLNISKQDMEYKSPVIDKSNKLFIFEAKPEAVINNYIKDDENYNPPEKIIRLSAPDDDIDKELKSNVDSESITIKLGTNNDAKTKEINCNVCWVFKHLDKCDHCKRPIKKDIDNKSTVEKKDVIEHTYKDCDENSAKRTETVPKTVKENIPRVWECSICLTTNKNRYECYGCDAKRLDDTVKINFGINPTFLLNTKQDLKEKSATEKKTFRFSDEQRDKPANQLFTASILSEEVLINYDLIEVIDDSTMTDVKPEITEHNNNMLEIMDIETENWRHDKDDVNINIVEETDVEDIPHMAMQTTANPITKTIPFLGNNLQFNVRSCTQVVRRKRSLRNTTRASHK